jgi:hypothetical protein
VRGQDAPSEDLLDPIVCNLTVMLTIPPKETQAPTQRVTSPAAPGDSSTIGKPLVPCRPPIGYAGTHELHVTKLRAARTRHSVSAFEVAATLRMRRTCLRGIATREQSTR